MGGFEKYPYHENKMTLNYDKKDIYGLPTITFDAEFKENEKNEGNWKNQAAEMPEAAGCKDVSIYDSNAPMEKAYTRWEQQEWGVIPKPLF